MCRTIHGVIQTIICGMQMVVRMVMTIMLLLENLIRLILQTIYNIMSFLFQCISLIPMYIVYLLATKLKCLVCSRGGGLVRPGRSTSCECIMTAIAFITVMIILRLTGVLDVIFIRFGYDAVNPPALSTTQMNLLNPHEFRDYMYYLEFNQWPSGRPPPQNFKKGMYGKFRFIDGKWVKVIHVGQKELTKLINGTKVDGIITNGVWQPGEYRDGVFVPGMVVDGKWQGGRFENGTFQPGEYHNGKFYPGRYNNGVFEPGQYINGTWQPGVVYNGQFRPGRFNENGEWESGRVENGTFQPGIVYNGEFHPGRYNKDGEWESGRIVNGTFQPGVMHNGEFRPGRYKDGVWESGRIDENGTFQAGVEHNGKFYPGKYVDGKWESGRYDENGVWQPGEFHDGKFYPGKFIDGEWVTGRNENGTFQPGYWHDGEFYHSQNIDGRWVTGRFENGTFQPGLWHNGIFYYGQHINGEWVPGRLENGKFQPGVYQDGKFYPGKFINGTWVSGRFVNGTFVAGVDYNGKFYEGKYIDGKWESGRYENGVWQAGVWYNGEFCHGKFINGQWVNGMYRNGTWVNGVYCTNSGIFYPDLKVNPETNKVYGDTTKPITDCNVCYPRIAEVTPGPQEETPSTQNTPPMPDTPPTYLCPICGCGSDCPDIYKNGTVYKKTSVDINIVIAGGATTEISTFMSTTEDDPYYYESSSITCLYDSTVTESLYHEITTTVLSTGAATMSYPYKEKTDLRYLESIGFVCPKDMCSCFKWVDGIALYTAAENVCEHLTPMPPYPHLVQLDSRKKNQFLMSISYWKISGTPWPSVIVQGKWNGKQYVTFNGWSLNRTGFDEWERGHPWYRRCVALRFKSMKLIDVACDDFHHFICEIYKDECWQHPSFYRVINRTHEPSYEWEW